MSHISPRVNRGTSVIAALIFAAILGGIALSLNAVHPQTARSITAAADAATAPASGAGATNSMGYTDDCTAVVQEAANQGQESHFNPITDSSKENLKDSCVAAVTNPATVDSMQKNYPGDWRFRTGTYKCVGKSGTIVSNSDGTFTERMNADSAVPAGKCSTRVCDVSGKCTDSQLATGVTTGGSGTPFGGMPSAPGSPEVTPNQSGSGWCGNGAGNPPVCDTCPAYTSMQNGICQLNGAGTNEYLNGTNGPSSNPTSISSSLTPGTSGATLGGTAGNPPPIGSQQPASGPCPTGQPVDASGNCTLSYKTEYGSRYCGEGHCQPGQILTQPYYCMTSAEPIIVQPLSAGSAFPSNCLNNGGALPTSRTIQNSYGGMGNFFTGLARGTFGGGNPSMMGGNPAGANNCNFITSLFGCQSANVSCQISLSPNPPQQGSPASLTWTTYGNVGYAQIPGIGTVGPSGTYTVYPNGQTNYTLQIEDQNGSQNSCSTQANTTPRTGCTGNSSCVSPQNPYGVGTDGRSCSQPPAQPDAAQCTTSSWQPTSAGSNGCTTGYQCVSNGSGSGAPTAQLSCSPQTVEVGETVAVAYACGGGSTTASSSAFTTNGLSGSATIVVPTPPANTNTATYRLACTNAQGQTTGAQCSVQINQPSIVLVANPAQVPTGQTTTIGWVTSGMKSCVVSSPSDTSFTSQNANNQSVGGMAVTSAITGTTEYDLTCNTIGGSTKTASTTVKIGASANAQNVTVISSADAKTINHGDTVSIQWQSQNAPSNSAVSLWLIDLRTQAASALIAGGLSTSGTYQWKVPAVGSSCDTNSPIACASDLSAGSSYGIEAAVYHPANAFLGGANPPSGATSPSYSDSGYTPNRFSIGQ